MRILAGLLIAAAALATSACGAEEGPDPAPDLFREYVWSTDVDEDRLPSAGSADDRVAHIAAYYSIDDLRSLVFSTFKCDYGADDQTSGQLFDTRCETPDRVRSAVANVDDGSENDISARVLVVKHEDGSLELLTLYLASGKVFDTSGEPYEGLDDFRENNGLLDAGDLVLAPRDLTALSGGGELVVVYGHTPTYGWVWWSLGGVVIVVGLFVVFVVRARRRAQPLP